MARDRAPTSARNAIRARLAAMGAPCAICGRPIDYGLAWWTDPVDGKRKRHPLSFEWDHIEPRSRGGADTMDNAQPVHRICNQKAGDKSSKSRLERRTDRETDERRACGPRADAAGSTSRAW